MMYPTAMATVPLNSNHQYVNMGYHPVEEVSANAARVAITRNGISGSNSPNHRSGAKAHGKPKNHKTKTRPQNRQRRAATAYEPKRWQYESVPVKEEEEEKESWQLPTEVPQLSVSRRQASRGSRMARVINKTNLGGPWDSDSSSNNNQHNNNINEEESVVAVPIDEGLEEDQDPEGDNEDVEELSGRTRSSITTSIKPTAKNPITTTTRRMNVNNNNNSMGDEDYAEEQEDHDDDEDDVDGGDDDVANGASSAPPAVRPELNGLPKYSFLRGDNFNNRNPAMQYDSAIINNNNGNMNRDSSRSSTAEVGVASASTTPTAMELECVAGYDGGLPQFFVLEAYDSRTRKLRLNITSAFPDLPLFRIDMEGT